MGISGILGIRGTLTGTVSGPARRRPLVLLLAMACLLGACGTGVSATPSAGSTGSATPASVPTLVGVTVTHGDSVSGSLYSLSGQVIGTAALGTVGDSGRAVTGSNGIYLLHAGSLARINRDGSVEQLESGLPDALLGPVVSPDGTQWMYSVVAWDAAGATATTSIYVDGKGQFHHLIAQLQRDATAGGGYPPLLWLSQGIVLGATQKNPAPSGPYQAERSSRGSGTLMDPGSGGLSQALTPTRCRFGDLALTGNAVACLQADGGDVIRSILVTAPAAAAVSVPLPANDGVGEMHFSVDGTQLVFTIAHADRSVPGRWRQDAYVVSTPGGTPRLLVSDVSIIDTTGHPVGALAQMTPSLHGSIALLDLTTGAATTVLGSNDAANPAGAVGVVCQ